MTDVKEPRAAKPESLEAKFKLLAVLPYDKRAKRKHSLVFGFILDWYHSKYGDALASVRHVTATIKERDPAGKGLYAGDVHSALSDLVAWGFLHQEKGSGRRASRYVPNWSLVCSVQKTPNIKDDEFSVRENANTSVRETPNTTTDTVRDSTNEDPSTVTRPQDGVNGIDGQDCAAPTAPPLDGLTAITAGTAQEGFEELWSAYGYKRKKKEARAAYEKLAPDADLHATMVEAATAWRGSWAAQNKPEAPRFHLHKWLEREEYECDPPSGFKTSDKPRKGAASANRSKIVPDNDDSDITFSPSRAGTHCGKIVAAEVEDTVLTVRLDSGFKRDIHLEHKKPAVQDAGQAELGQLSAALGRTVDDSSELIGLHIIVDEYADGSAKWSADADDTIIDDDFKLNTRGPNPNMPKFADVVARVPQLGWASMIGTAYDDDEDEVA